MPVLPIQSAAGPSTGKFYALSKRHSGQSVIGFTGSISNNSNETVDSVIIDFILQNGKSNVEVLRLRFAISKNIYKTATVEFKDALAPADYAGYDPKRDDAAAFYTLNDAVLQLGENFGWRYEFVAAIPESISREYGHDAYRAMKVDVVLL